MFRINKLTDYAVVLLSQMARSDGQHTATEIADGTGVPLPTVAKILKSLGKDGLVTSRRGAGGGYVLGRDAARITVADIVQAIEGPIAITACVDDTEEQCGIESMCPAHGKWNRVNASIRAALASVTLAEMAADAGPFAAFSPNAEREAVHGS